MINPAGFQQFHCDAKLFSFNTEKKQSYEQTRTIKNIFKKILVFNFFCLLLHLY